MIVVPNCGASREKMSEVNLTSSLISKQINQGVQHTTLFSTEEKVMKTIHVHGIYVEYDEENEVVTHLGGTTEIIVPVMENVGRQVIMIRLGDDGKAIVTICTRY